MSEIIDDIKARGHVTVPGEYSFPDHVSDAFEEAAFSSAEKCDFVFHGASEYRDVAKLFFRIGWELAEKGYCDTATKEPS